MTSAAKASTTSQAVTRLTDQDLYLFNEGTHLGLAEKLGAHVMTADGGAGTYFAVWAPSAEAVSVMGEFNGWRPGQHPLRPRAMSGIWEGFVPAVGRGAPYKYHVVSRIGGYQVDKADPFAFHGEVPPRTGVDRVAARVRVERRGVDGAAARPQRAGRAARHLRGAPGLVASHAGGRQPLARVPGDRTVAGRLRRRGRLHPRRAVADHGAPVLRLLGVPDDRLLLAHQSLRDAAGPDVPDRPPSPARDRRHPRLGAVALPDRRARPRLLRRRAPLRAPGSAAGLPPRLGQLHLQLRPQRGAQLPAEQRPLLARPVPCGRPSRGRRRLHALPRLLAPRRRVDPQQVRRAGESRGDRFSAPPEHQRLRAPARGADATPRSRPPGRWSRGRRTSAGWGSG